MERYTVVYGVNIKQYYVIDHNTNKKVLYSPNEEDAYLWIEKQIKKDKQPVKIED